MDIEGSRVVFPGRAGKRVDGVTDHDVDEANVFEDRPPARTGQPASNSAGPEIDVT